MSRQTYSISGNEVSIQDFTSVPLPSPFSEFLARHLVIEPDSVVLDVGCGSGLQSIVSAMHGAARVLGVDMDSQCAEATRYNADLNGCGEVIEVVVGDMYSGVTGLRFDNIISNPPTLPDTSATPLFCRASDDGRGFLDPLIVGAAKHLRPGGNLQLVHSSLADLGRSREMLDREGFEVVMGDSAWISFREFYFAHMDFFEAQARLGRAEYRREGGRYFERIHNIRAHLR